MPRAFPATNRQAIGLAALAALVLPAASLISNPVFLQDQNSYLSVHSYLELFSIVVSVLIAGVGWNTTHGSRSAHMTVVAAGFLAVGLLDFAHMLSYSGMPDLVTPAGPEKAIFFWLAARFASALTLLTVVIMPSNWTGGRGFRAAGLLLSLTYTGIVHYLVLYHGDDLPHTFIPGQGLTAIKIEAEHAVAGIFAAGAVLVWLRRSGGSVFHGPMLLAALLMMVASEIALMLYSSVHDIYNFVGHLYKVAGTYLIYRAVFVDAVQAPYISLQRSEKKYRQLLEQAADSILMIDDHGHVIAANERAQTMTGLGRSELIQRRITDLIADWKEPGQPAGQPGDSETVIWESHLLQSPVRETPVEISARRLDSGETQAIIRDISERKHSESRLHAALALAEQANRAKSAFLANMSHELRTPLNAVLGFSELMRAETLGPLGNPRYLGYADDIHAGGTHLLTIINDILDVARVESGQYQLDESEVDIAAAVDGCVRLVTPSASHLTLSTVNARQPITLRADARAIRQIILNLLSNAVKFTPAGGRIDVATGIAPNGNVELTISDTGIGIAEKDLPHVTEAFMQVESTYFREHQGTGLGLAITKALVELHGGKLHISSEVGIGTTVTVILPNERLAAPTLAALA